LAESQDKAFKEWKHRLMTASGLMICRYVATFVVELGFYSAADGPSRQFVPKFLPSNPGSLRMATSLTVRRIVNGKTKKFKIYFSLLYRGDKRRYDRLRGRESPPPIISDFRDLLDLLISDR
jgi:hypothetical protein